MKHSTPDLMKFKRLERRLQLPRYSVAGVLEMLWISTAKNAPAGDIGRFDNEAIAIEIDWKGDPDELVAALVETGWLDECQKHRLIVHDWAAHSPRWVHANAMRQGGFAVRQLPTTVDDYSPELQSKTAVKSKCDVSGSSVRPKNGTQSTTTVGNYSPELQSDTEVDSSRPPACARSYQTKPNLTKYKDTGGPETPKTASSEPATFEGLPDALEFPCDGNPSAWRLTESQAAHWRGLFPELDILGECRAALAWVLAVPTRRKTARGMPRFLVGWFKRSMDRQKSPTQKGNGNGRQLFTSGPGQRYDPTRARDDDDSVTL